MAQHHEPDGDASEREQHRRRATVTDRERRGGERDEQRARCDGADDVDVEDDGFQDRVERGDGTPHDERDRGNDEQDQQQQRAAAVQMPEPS